MVLHIVYVLSLVLHNLKSSIVIENIVVIFTIEALQGCLAKSMLALEALICFSRSRRFSAFLRAPVFFLGIFHCLSDRKRFAMNACKTRHGSTWIYTWHDMDTRATASTQTGSWSSHLLNVSSPFISFPERLSKRAPVPYEGSCDDLQIILWSGKDFRHSVPDYLWSVQPLK